MNPIEELYGLKNSVKDIQKELEILDQLKAIATSMTVSTEKENVQSSGSQDKMANIVAKIIDLEAIINDKVDDFVDTKEFAKEVIFEIENENYQNTLYDFFICDIPIYQIAENYDVKYEIAKQWFRRSKEIYKKIYTNKKKHLNTI